MRRGAVPSASPLPTPTPTTTHPHPRSLPLILAAKRAGKRLTAETCPHYLNFAHEEIPDGDTRFKCAPPIREAENRERLWEALMVRCAALCYLLCAIVVPFAVRCLYGVLCRLLDTKNLC